MAPLSHLSVLHLLVTLSPSSDPKPLQACLHLSCSLLALLLFFSCVLLSSAGRTSLEWKVATSFNVKTISKNAVSALTMTLLSLSSIGFLTRNLIAALYLASKTSRLQCRRYPARECPDGSPTVRRWILMSLQYHHCCVNQGHRHCHHHLH